MNDEVKISSDALDEFLSSDVGEFLKTTQSIDNTVREIQVAKEAGLPTPEGIASSIETFLQQGASVLETMTVYCNNMPDAESVNALSSLINSLTSAINKIANLYKTEQTHRNRIELEEKKHELRMEEIKYKEQLKAIKAGGKDVIGGEEPEEMVEFNTAEIVDQLARAKRLN